MNIEVEENIEPAAEGRIKGQQDAPKLVDFIKENTDADAIVFNY